MRVVDLRNPCVAGVRVIAQDRATRTGVRGSSGPDRRGLRSRSEKIAQLRPWRLSRGEDGGVRDERQAASPGRLHIGGGGDCER